MDLGPELRRIREARGADLAQVSAATKIGRHHLEALERGDFAALPDDVFVRGFIRAYAAFLGVDPSRLLAAHRGTPIAPDRTLTEMSRLLQSREPGTAYRRVGLRVGFFAGLAAIATGATLLLQPHPAKPIQQPLRASRLVPPAPLRETPAPSPVAVEPPPPPLPLPTPSPRPQVQRATQPPAVPQLTRGTLTVTEHSVGGSGQPFPQGSVVSFRTRVAGGRRGDLVQHVWIHEGREVHSQSLDVGSADWGTRSSKTLRSTGHWAVEARDESGRVLARDEFECVPLR